MIKLAGLGWTSFFLSLFTVCIMTADIKIMQIHAESPQLVRAQKHFRRMIHGLAPDLKELKLEKISESEYKAECMRIFGPPFAYVAKLFPNPIREAECIVGIYVEFVKEMPPMKLFEPIIEEAVKRDDKIFIDRLSRILSLKRMMLRKLNQNDQIGLMRDLLEEFELDPDARQADVQNLFPQFDNSDEALLSCIKRVFLTRRILDDGNRKGRVHLPRLLEPSPQRKDIFESSCKFFGYLYAYNYILRLIHQARLAKENKAQHILQIYNFATTMFMTDSIDMNLPVEILRRYNQIKFKGQKEKAYVQWKLENINIKKRKEFVPEEYQFVAGYLSLHQLVLKQIMICLEKFIDPAWITPGSKTHLFPMWREFFTQNIDLTITDSVPAKTVLKIFNNRMDKIIPEKIKKIPKYHLLADFTRDEIALLLAPTVEQIETTKREQSYIDFSTCQAQKKKSKKRGNKGTPAPNQIIEKDDMEKKLGKEPEEILVSGEDENEENLVLIEEISVEENTADDGQVYDEELVKAEIEELMRQQEAEIQRYKKLKKQNLDLAKSQLAKVKIVNEKTEVIKKTRMISYLHTDDFRLINHTANELYLKNSLEDSALHHINAGGSSRFRWVFNPEVVIDLDAYKFLCQVFSLVRGERHLTFSNFLSTFNKLNPKKGILPELKGKALNRTVFQFDHAFESGDIVYVPPIGGAHAEHLSSRFNHSQIQKFLMHGGCHPYFFERI